jgi:hypothetical protein
MLARELGSNYQIHRDTLRKLFGPRYIDALEGMAREGFIEQSLDNVNPSVHVIRILQPGIDCLARRKAQRKREKQAAEDAAFAQGREDAIALVGCLNVTRAGKAYAVTEERLAKVLGSPVWTRLDYLMRENYLTTFGDPDCPGQYELKFLARSLELFPAEGQGRPKKRLDPRNRKGALIRYGKVDGLAINARCWLRNLADPQRSKANASETMLQDLIGHRYMDLQEKYPDLLLEIKAALEGSQSVRGTPTEETQATECV